MLACASACAPEPRGIEHPPVAADGTPDVVWLISQGTGQSLLDLRALETPAIDRLTAAGTWMGRAFAADPDAALASLTAGRFVDLDAPPNDALDWEPALRTAGYRLVQRTSAEGLELLIEERGTPAERMFIVVTLPPVPPAEFAAEHKVDLDDPLPLDAFEEQRRWVARERERRPDRDEALLEQLRLLAYVDAQIELVLAALQERGDALLFAWSATRGDYAARRALPGSGPFLYDDLLHVPLVFASPGRIPAGDVRPQVISTLDVLPTLLDFAGATAEARAGQSFARLLLKRPQVWRDHVFMRAQREIETRAIRARDWKLISNPADADRDETFELYQLEADRSERYNLIGAARARVSEADLRERLRAWLDTEPGRRSGR